MANPSKRSFPDSSAVTSLNMLYGVLCKDIFISNHICWQSKPVDIEYLCDYNSEGFVRDRSRIITSVCWFIGFCYIHTIIHSWLPCADGAQAIPTQIHYIDADVAAQTEIIEFNDSGETRILTLKWRWNTQDKNWTMYSSVSFSIHSLCSWSMWDRLATPTICHHSQWKSAQFDPVVSMLRPISLLHRRSMLCVCPLCHSLTLRTKIKMLIVSTELRCETLG